MSHDDHVFISFRRTGCRFTFIHIIIYLRIISPDDIIDKAVSYNLNVIALTDTNAMHGLIPFYKKANEKGIKPILGTYIDEPTKNTPLSLPRRGAGGEVIYALFLAKNFAGYSDLCKIITSRKLKNDFTLFRLLQEYFPDLFYHFCFC